MLWQNKQTSVKKKKKSPIFIKNNKKIDHQKKITNFHRLKKEKRSPIFIDYKKEENGSPKKFEIFMN